MVVGIIVCLGLIALVFAWVSKNLVSATATATGAETPPAGTKKTPVTYGDSLDRSTAFVKLS